MRIVRILVTAALFSLPALAQTPLGIFEGHADIGTVLHPGSAAYDPGQKTYTVQGSGQNMWAAEDDFHYVWKKVAGDLTLSADISFIGTGGDPHRKGALMIRRTLDQDSDYVDAALHGSGLTSLQSRDTKGGITREVQSNVLGPKRLRIEKRGDYFFMSVAGVTSNEALQFSGGSMKLAPAESFYVGLAVCAHNKDATEQVVFSNVELKQGSTGTPAIYTTLESVAVQSTDRKVISVAKEGQYIYYDSAQGETRQIWRKQADGSAPEQLTRDAFENWMPHVSPDGTQVAFLSRDPKAPGDDIQIRNMVLATKAIRVIANLIGGPATFTADPWSPDSKNLTFRSYQFRP